MNQLIVSATPTLDRSDWNHLTRQAASWYGTPGHCLLYSFSPSEWVALWRNESTEPTAACFGSTGSWLRIGRFLRLNGPTTASFAMLKQLMAGKGAQLLTIPLIAGPGRTVSLPWWRGAVLSSPSDWVVELPATYAEYLERLGKTSRNHLTAYARGFERTVASRLSILEGADISLELVAALADLHRQRMEKAEKKVTLTREKIRQRAQLAQECGLFCGRWVEDRLIGGTLNYFHGSMVYLSLVAHDSRYDDRHGGLVCLLDTIRYLIEKGISAYNFHYRYSPFKTRMGGKEREHHGEILFANAAVALLWHTAKLARGVQRRVRRIRQTILQP